jgi:hypothetical protein
MSEPRHKDARPAGSARNPSGSADQELPVRQFAKDILAAVKANDTVVVIGEGKGAASVKGAA